MAWQSTNDFMGEYTNISWCDSTVNPTSGCDGCELFNPSKPDDATCYAKGIHESRLALSLPKLYAPRFNEVRLIPGRMKKAFGWRDLSGTERKGKPHLNDKPRFIFVGDMADIFSKAVPFEFLREEVFFPMRTEKGARHFYIVLTKRPQRMAEFSKWLGVWPNNCIAMTSITDQKSADARIPHLMNVEAKLLGISAEPLHEHLVIPLFQNSHSTEFHDKIKWLVCGGESGARRKDCGVEAIEFVARQGANAGVPTFVKQDSAFRDGERGRISEEIWKLKQVPI